MTDTNTTGFRVVLVDFGTDYHWFHAVSDTVYTTHNEADAENHRLEAIAIAEYDADRLRCAKEDSGEE